MATPRSLALSTLRMLASAIPEGGFKNRLRAALLSLRRALPRELMISGGDTVVQVGMWRRRNLVRLSRCAGRSGRVILIEADPRVAKDLAEWIDADALGNVTLVAKGAFNQPGKQEFRVGTSSAFSRLDASEATMMAEVEDNAFDTTIEIEVDTLDNVLAGLGVDRVSYAEITVNGLELQVLQGMEATLPRTDRVFLSGYSRSVESGESTNAVTEEFLRRRGFRTKISKRTLPTGVFEKEEHALEWGLLDGHVFAWRA